MAYFRQERLNDHLVDIHGITDEQMYLVTGRTRAFLIDTGCGFGDLKEVSSLTSLPVTVILTHGHTDHAMGAGAFSDVYMNPLDIPVFAQHADPEYRKQYVLSAPGCPADIVDHMVPAPDARGFHELAGGQVFRDGDLSLQVFSCPGHTKGSMCVLLPEDRILITGDACNPAAFLFFDHSTGIRTYQESLIALKKKVDGRYDRVRFSHGNVEGGTQVLDEAIELCDEIREGRADDVPFAFLGQKAWIAKAIGPDLMRTDGKMANIVYDRNRIEE